MFREKLNELVTKNPSFSDLIPSLNELLINLDNAYKPSIIIIGGSLARGKFVRGLSDIDVILITDYRPNVRHIIRHVNDTDVEIAFYSFDEILIGMSRGNNYIIDSVYKGFIIKGSNIIREKIFVSGDTENSKST